MGPETPYPVAIQCFLQERQQFHQLAESSIRTYKTGLKQYGTVINGDTISISEALTDDNALEYFSWLDEQQYKPATIYSRRIALGMLWRWAFKKGFASCDVPYQTQKPSADEPEYLEIDEVHILIETAKRNSSKFANLHLRNEACFSLLVETGVPFRVLSRLRVDDFDESAGTLVIGSYRVVLSATACSRITVYLATRDVADPAKEPLFTAYNNHSAWKPANIREAISRHRKDCQLPQLEPATPTHPSNWSEGERSRFLSTPVTPCDNSRRDELVIRLGVNCGLRRDEIVNLNVGDVDRYKRQLHVRGKGNTVRIIELTDTVFALLQTFIDHRDDGEPLITSATSKRLLPKAINRIVNRIAKRSGLRKPITPHTLRHTFATHIAVTQGDHALLVLRDLLGHKDVNTTTIYVHIDRSRQRQAVESLPY